MSKIPEVSHLGPWKSCPAGIIRFGCIAHADAYADFLVLFQKGEKLSIHQGIDISSFVNE